MNQNRSRGSIGEDIYHMLCFMALCLVVFVVVIVFIGLSCSGHLK